MSSESCPLCQQNPATNTTANFDIWLQCDTCSDWYHAHCLKIDNVDLIEKFYCPPCQVQHDKSVRKSSRSSTRLNYADLNEGTAAGDERIWQRLLQAKQFQNNTFPRYTADQISIALFRKTGLREPLIIEKNEPELGMMMPTNLTVTQIAELVGRDRPLEVIDVATQSEITSWTLGRWADYFSNPVRDRIRNVISLEISGTALAEKITRPQVVREMDWVDLAWPKDAKERPKVQLYCLMGTKDSYTDFHIDFGGSSVFYHVLSGAKTFYLIEPTPKNLKKYQKWSSSPDQSVTFFGDLVKDCYSVELRAGNTMFIPTGWIHAVYTPEDAIVIGGNFLHSFNAATQLRVYQIEQATDVPIKFRFPYYKKLNWYALEKFDEWLREKREFSYFELESMAVLTVFFANSVSEEGKMNMTIRHKHDIPDTIEDPLGLTKRVLENSKLALLSSDIELPKTKKKTMKKKRVSRIKRELEEEDEFDEELEEKLKKDDDDDEWNPNEEYSEEPEVNNVNIPMNPMSTKKRKVNSNNDISDEDEDSMGTSSKKTTLHLKRKRSGYACGSNASQKEGNTSTSTVKQRLLERMSNKRHH
ncbi:hypothetical protein G6F62_006965 [Rhizopus arrhizus]|nr:hypothetical protein G6F23_008232 [Rhizopus arrhizus]KAG1333028.1 hypothetical protein G6F62_006965 [Rhizopus arrhizus]